MKRTYGGGGLTQRGQVWWGSYYKAGRKIRFSTGETSRSKAQQKLMAEMAKARTGHVDINREGKLTYADLRRILFDHYRDKGNRSMYANSNGDEYINGIAALDAYFGDKFPALDIDTDEIKKFIEARRADGVKDSTTSLSLRLLHSMLQLAVDERKLNFVPKVPMMTAGESRKGFLEEKDFYDLLSELPSHLRPLILCLYRTGVRVGEARQITWDQVDFSVPGSNGVIWLEAAQAKNKTARTLPLTQELAQMLKGTPLGERTGLVFDDSNLRRAWNQACDLLGYGNITVKPGLSPSKGAYKGLMVHDLRRSALRNLRKAGITEGVIMKISGHKTRSVFERYNITDVADQINAIDALEKIGHNLGTVSQFSGVAIQ